MRYFCTYFDHHYLPRGLALYESLKQYCSSFRLWVLCMDQKCYEVLSQMHLPEVSLIALQEFERGDEKLLTAKQNRSLVEYYFTCTPSLPLFVLNNYREVDLITYLDADLFFYADPDPIYDEIAENSIAIIGHRFPPHLRHLEKYGTYNVGWISFRRDGNGLACLQWWRQQCIEWCYDRYENGRFADQAYLNQWPTRFYGVVVLHHKGANLAPWNLANYTIRKNGNHVWVDEQPLIFFHFHKFKQVKKYLYEFGLAGYEYKPSRVILQDIYQPYIRTLLAQTQRISHLLPGVSFQGNIRSSPNQSLSGTRYMAQRLRMLLSFCKGVFARRYFIVLNGRIII